MLIGINEASYGKFREQRPRIFREILKFNNIDFTNLNVSEPDFIANVSKCDLFIYRWMHTDKHRQIAHTILPFIENVMKIKCFPDQNTCWHFDDKIKQYYLLEYHRFPIIKSWVFWDEESAIQWAQTAFYPVVFKLKSGAGSTNVVLVKNKTIAGRLIKKMFREGIYSQWIPIFGNVRFHDVKTFAKKLIGPAYYRLKGQEPDRWTKERGYVLFQKFLPGNTFDTRITTIGDRAFGFRRFVRKNDFRASGSGKVDTDPKSIDPRCVKIALEVSRHLKFQTMTYDFLFDEKNEPHFCEISYSYTELNVQSCPGFWDKDLNWHEGHYWPQYFQLMDALGIKDLKQPQIEACPS
jgi:glutathione synthase/RimK-type ligase-like ATP-grasp enzyme